MRDEEGNPVPYKGTGLYFGSGWIMTVAHNFQAGNEMNETIHSIFLNGKFRVEFDIEGQKYVFPAEERKRMAFIHHLEPTGRRCRSKKQRYRHGETRSPIDPPTPKKDETVYAVHFGGATDDKKSEESKILRITPPSPNQVSMLHLEKKIGVLPAGASGCPIMVKREDNYRLVGLHFSGHADSVDGEAQALQWNQGIRDCIDRGVGIIAEIESYMGNRKAASEAAGSMEEALNEEADKSLKELKRMARDAKLTIYLCNGVVINQK
ncbi:hypothetical protein OS493_028001 [Desmophyllum pertusum]|uniref:Serine protease n=1 Tax=Desmophyllum pertusum TaxID=174260 RepID=A0A9X0D822_9CNID|nr:hypothetical protein OS493_028001 [Desmophyllum pertusum]